MESKALADKICRILDEKKAKDITVIDVGGLTVVADYFVIASATSNTAVKALCNNLEEQLEKEEITVLRKEGYNEGRWIAMDYGSVIVHLFHFETRKFYGLERLWIEGANSYNYPEEKIEA